MNSHKSDQITRHGLEKIREHCHNHKCENCSINNYCDDINYWLINLDLPEIDNWTDSDITDILKATRNYMEATFIESLEEIVEQDGECGIIQCDDCPFWHTDTRIDYNNYHCARTCLHDERDARHTERKEIAEWLLDIYRGEYDEKI